MTTTNHQEKTFGPVKMKDGYQIWATVRFDDRCKNGHNTFSITGHTMKGGIEGSFGCIHDEIAEYFPKLAPLIKWHLCNTDGPSGYIANTLYFAGNRDCHGLLAGEFRQHFSHGKIQNNGVEGVPNWELKFPKGFVRDIYSPTKPEPVTLEWIPSGRTGEGKVREFDSARHSAIWPEATDEQLQSPNLKELLLARLPALMVKFRAAVESLGFTY